MIAGTPIGWCCLARCLAHTDDSAVQYISPETAPLKSFKGLLARMQLQLHPRCIHMAVSGWAHGQDQQDTGGAICCPS